MTGYIVQESGTPRLRPRGSTVGRRNRAAGPRRPGPGPGARSRAGAGARTRGAAAPAGRPSRCSSWSATKCASSAWNVITSDAGAGRPRRSLSGPPPPSGHRRSGSPGIHEHVLSPGAGGGEVNRRAGTHGPGNRNGTAPLETRPAGRCGPAAGIPMAPRVIGQVFPGSGTTGSAGAGQSPAHGNGAGVGSWWGPFLRRTPRPSVDALSFRPGGQEQRPCAHWILPAARRAQHPRAGHGKALITRVAGPAAGGGKRSGPARVGGSVTGRRSRARRVGGHHRLTAPWISGVAGAAARRSPPDRGKDGPGAVPADDRRETDGPGR